MIIDFHTHTFPENVAATAIKKLADMSGMQSYGAGTETDLIARMDSAGIDHAVVLSVATKVEQVEKINRYNISRENDRLTFFGAMHPEYDNYEKEIDFLYRHGCKGVKLHPEFQNFYPSEKKYYLLYKALTERNMVIVFHSGKEEFVVRDRVYSDPAAFAAIHRDFPELQMVLAHFGGHKMFDECRSEIFGKNIYVDLSYEFTGENTDLLDKLLQYHSQEYIIYGSDWPWRPVESYPEFVKQANIREDARQAILYKNALNLL